MSRTNNIQAAIAGLGERINDIAKEKGWWDEERNNGEMIALMHSELSEALEWLRKLAANSVNLMFTSPPY